MDEPKRGPAWEAFVADLGCDYDDDPNSIMAYEAGRKDARAEGVAEGLRMAAAECKHRATYAAVDYIAASNAIASAAAYEQTARWCEQAAAKGET